MGITTLAAAALTCVAMFQGPRANLDEAIYATNGASTRLVFDTEDRIAGSGSSWFFTNAGTTGSVLFSGYASASGRELWTTNGLPTGTRLLKDINQGANFWSNPGGPSNPASVPNGGTSFSTRFQKVGDKIIFPATSFRNGRELWASNGTAVGTVLIKDHLPGAADGIDGSTIEFVYGNGLFAIYVVEDILRGKSLWATNGTPAGTRFIKAYPDFEVPWPTGTLGNQILFAVDDRSQLWATNGTVDGTRLIKTFGFRAIENISSLKGTNYALLSVYTPTHGQELWVTNGTAAGTKILRNINLHNESSSPGSYARDSEYGLRGAYFKIGNRVVFPATDDPAGRELWVTQGTPATTYRLANLTPGVEGSDFYQFTVLGNRLYFAAAVTEGNRRIIRPFVTDGTALGTRKLSTSLQVTGRMVSLRNTVIFPAYNPSFDQYLWRTGPTPNSQVAISPEINGDIEHLQSVNIPGSVNAPCPPQ